MLQTTSRTTISRVQTVSAPSARPKLPRLVHVDALRGFVMVLMALDHVRSFFHAKAIVFDPTDLTQTTPSIFFTRWITHLCAPVFVLLAGLAANLSRTRGRSPEALSGFLRSRGAWLIVVELTVVKFGWTFNFNYADVVGQVIWATGWAMIALSFFVRTSAERALMIGAGGLALHGLFVLIPAGVFGPASPLWAIFVSGEDIAWGSGYQFASKYPILPWAALLILGYGLGPVMSYERAGRRRILSLGGLGCLAGFAALRYVEMGGRAAFEGGARGLWFLDVEKYPPSLTFFLLTLGLGLLVFAAFDRDEGAISRRLADFGRVPFFFYVVHIPLIHLLAIVTEAALRPESPPFPALDWRLNLPLVYAIWIAVVAALYPPCRWFAELKKRRRDPWLSYL